MQLTVVAESESRIQTHCPWHRIDRRTAKIWRESLASWLCMTVECTVYSGPSHTSCLLGCWSLALIWQRSSVIEIPLVTLIANQKLGKPVTPELATTIFRDISFTKTTRWPVGCPFAAILWLHSLIKLWKAFGVNKNTVLLAVYREWRFPFPMFLEANMILAPKALTSCQVPSSTILAHAIPWARSKHSKRACHQRAHPWSKDMRSKKD